jgi:RNA recognition motif-containing protein
MRTRVSLTALIESERITMAKKLYVGNLPYSATNETLQELFGGIGEVVSINIIMDRFSGRPKGFGFVEMGSTEQAQQAIAEVNGREVEGRQITVAEARPQRTDQDRGPRRRERW